LVFPRPGADSTTSHLVKRVFFQFDLLGVPWGDDATPLIETLQAMVAGIMAKRAEGGGEKDDDKKVGKSLEEKLDSFTKPLDDGKKYVAYLN
jgi:hypothetical protein